MKPTKERKPRSQKPEHKKSYVYDEEADEWFENWW